MTPATDDAVSRLDRLWQAGRLLGYGLLGAVVTAVVGFVLLPLTNRVQSVIYDLFYLQVGPSEATETAILTHFLLASVLGLGAAMLAGDYLSDRELTRPVLAWAVAGLLGLVVLFLVVALAGLAAFLTVLIVLAIGFIGVPVALWYWGGMQSGVIPAFVGGIPVVVVLLLLAGFGLGWGWGYVMTAQEIPEPTVNESVASFDEVPEVRAALLVDGDCETTTEGRQICRMYLRGSDHERDAIRFMARHGVRCPYQNDGGRSDAFIAESDGRYYRVTCSPHGD